MESSLSDLSKHTSSCLAGFCSAGRRLSRKVCAQRGSAEKSPSADEVFLRVETHNHLRGRVDNSCPLSVLGETGGSCPAAFLRGPVGCQMFWASSRGEEAVRGGLDPQPDAAYHDMRSQSSERILIALGKKKIGKGQIKEHRSN